MAIDHRVPLGVQTPQIQSPLDSMAKVGHIRAQEQDAQMRQMQIQDFQRQREAEDAQAQAQAATQSAARDAIAQIRSGNADQVLSQLQPEARVIAEDWLAKFNKNAADRKALLEKDRKERAQLVRAFGYDPTVAEVMFGLDEDPEAQAIWQRLGGNQDALKQVVDTFATFGDQPPEGFTLSEGQVRFGPDGQPVATNPKPAPEPKMYPVRVRGTDGRPVEKLFTAEELQRGVPAYQEPKGAADEPIVAIMGPDGKAIYVPRSQAIGQTPATGSIKPASGLEKRSLNFYNRAQQADVDIEAMEPAIQAMSLGGQTWMAWAPNFAQTDIGQRYRQAQRAFTEARLRKDSGAAIPTEEYENDQKTYFAQPGDSPETLAQKRRGRAAVLASLGFESGQALAEFVGSADEAQKQVQGYKERAAVGGPSGAATRKVGDVVSRNGQKIRIMKILPNGKYEGTPVQ